MLLRLVGGQAKPVPPKGDARRASTCACTWMTVTIAPSSRRRNPCKTHHVCMLLDVGWDCATRGALLGASPTSPIPACRGVDGIRRSLEVSKRIAQRFVPPRGIQPGCGPSVLLGVWQSMREAYVRVERFISRDWSHAEQ